MLQIERFCLSLKTINLVLLRFREGLFALKIKPDWQFVHLRV